MKRRYKRWFSARCIFLHKGLHSYEERIVLLSATSLDDAIARGEADAVEYARDAGDFLYTGLIQVYKLPDRDIRTGTEIFSLFRDSQLPVDEYLDRYFDTKSERQQG